MLRTIALWLFWLLVFAGLTAAGGHYGVRGVTSNPRSMTEPRVTRERAPADRRKPDCREATLAEDVR